MNWVDCGTVDPVHIFLIQFAFDDSAVESFGYTVATERYGCEKENLEKKKKGKRA